MGGLPVTAPKGAVPIHPGKLTPPQGPSDAILRTRIISWLEQAREPVVLLSAPPGFGKTIVMRQWYDRLNEGGHPAGWLTLDDRDNDFARLLTYLQATLASTVELPVRRLRLDRPSRSYARLHGEALATIDALAAFNHPFTLFIDDFEKLTSGDGLRLINDLILALTPGQRVVFGSRTMRLMPLSSLVIKGLVAKVSVDELRFDMAEVLDFFGNQKQLDLSDEQIRCLKGRTEGWPAGLRLVTLALPGLPANTAWIEDISGRAESFSEYLTENVLARLPEDERKFMVYSSILELLNPDVCDELLGRTDSARMLHSLHNANLFISPVTATSDWYRFHALMRDFLLAELKRTDTAAINDLHRRAATVLARHDQHLAAVTHALLSEDMTLAANIIESCAMDFVEASQLETVARWVDSLPGAEVESRLRLQRARAYSMIALHRFEDARLALDSLRDGALRAGRDVDPEVYIQFALLCAWSDHHDLAEIELAKVEGKIKAGDGLMYGTAQNIHTYLQILRGEYAKAESYLSKAKASYGRAEMARWPFTFTLCFEGIIQMLQGDPRGATARFESAYSDADGASLPIACTYLADALYEQHHLSRAGTLTEGHLWLIRKIGSPDVIILGYGTAARVAFLNGRHDQADMLLTELADLGDIKRIPRLKAAAWLEKSRLALLGGKHDAACRFLKLATTYENWGRYHGGIPPYPHEINDVTIAGARIDIVIGSSEKVIPRLEDDIRLCRERGRVWRILRLQNLLAQAYATSRKRGLAIKTMEDALRVGARGEYIHVFADEPWHLLDLLDEISSRPNSPAKREYVRRVADAARMIEVRTTEIAMEKAISEILTAKESEVMRLVAEGRSNKEIARILRISDNTVETHLRRINQKLDVRNRTQAVARVREYGLLR